VNVWPIDPAPYDPRRFGGSLSQIGHCQGNFGLRPKEVGRIDRVRAGLGFCRGECARRRRQLPQRRLERQPEFEHFAVGARRAIEFERHRQSTRCQSGWQHEAGESCGAARGDVAGHGLIERHPPSPHLHLHVFLADFRGGKYRCREHDRGHAAASEVVAVQRAQRRQVNPHYFVVLRIGYEVVAAGRHGGLDHLPHVGA